MQNGFSSESELMKLVEFTMSLPVVRYFNKLAMFIEAWWFDRKRGVRTMGEVELEGLTLVGDRKSALQYIPVRPSVARRALRHLPVENYSDFTFVDFGSGKGRVLFLAAEYPFRRIEGIEFATELHNSAKENIRRYKSRKQICPRIASLCMDAVNYKFPDENLVLYFFNPFGPDVMERILCELVASLEKNPREVIVVTVFPKYESLMRATRKFRLHESVRRYQIYRTHGCNP